LVVLFIADVSRHLPTASIMSAQTLLVCLIVGLITVRIGFGLVADYRHRNHRRFDRKLVTIAFGHSPLRRYRRHAGASAHSSTGSPERPAAKRRGAEMCRRRVSRYLCRLAVQPGIKPARGSLELNPESNPEVTVIPFESRETQKNLGR
jgi:hypothetical protein